MDRNNQSQVNQRGRSVTSVDAAKANEYFEQFVNAATLKHILGYYRGLIENLHLKPNVFTHFYPKLRANLTSWRAKALWKKFDARASHKCYLKGKAAANTRVLIIGGGPCGLRTAIEAQLLGAKVVVIEKRDRFSRNNVLHLWPFVIEDLRMLGAKKFFGKFCAGAIDHISIRQLQCILLKAALLLGVEVHTEVSFEKLLEPSATEKTGWRAEFKPSNHPVSLYEFDVIIGADGKRNTLQGFSRKEFRGKLAIAITANFINKKTEAEARVEEISGVAFIFNQKFFKELLEETRIDLENIVYYKDDTHYFVMTAKKASLLEKGVIKQDLADTEKLLAPDNVDREALQQYAIEAANFSTNYQMPDLEFAVNHYGQPDIAMFDFTSMYAAENASKVIERNGHRLLMILVGDSLLEPFWPTGSGCARGFLSSLDAAWATRSWSLGTLSPLDVMSERESIYRLLAQTTPDNLNKDWKSYTLDPATRYPNLNKTVVTPHQVVYLYDTDCPPNIEKMKRSSIERPSDVPRKRRRGNVDNDILLSWLKGQLKEEVDITVTDIGSVFKSGKCLCAIIHHYRPDLLDYNSVKDDDPVKNNQLAIDILEKELGIPPVMTGQEITNTEDYLTMATYLTEIYNNFKGEIPHIKHPKLELPESTKISDLSFKTIKTSNIQAFSNQPSRPSSRHKRHIEMPPNKSGSIDKKTRKRRALEKVGASVEERQKLLEELAANRTDRQNRRRQQRKLQTEQFLKSMQMLQANAKPDSQPFEDYAIFLYRQTAPKFEDRVKDLEKQFTYVPDHESKISVSTSRAGGTDEDLAARIKSFEDKWKEPEHVEKKPKDLLRAIGKIENSDWNIREIEKKMLENKMGKPSKVINKEKVPKWSKEQFLARQTKMEKKHLDRQESAEAKFADIDKTIKDLDQKLKEGTVRQLGTNKVATLTEKLVSKIPPELKPPEKPVSRPPVLLPIKGGSEMCHFCGKRVYLMEKLSAEGRFFHHGCFKCQYCHTQLRLGSYAFDKDGMYGFKFFCLHHFGMVGELEQPKITKKTSQRLANELRKSPDNKNTSNITGVDLLDRVQTPERVEFANLSLEHISSDQDESLSQMDEDEWTDKNFGASCAEVADSDDESSSLSSDTDSDDEDAYDDALEQPVTKEGTMKWAERLKNSYSRKKHDSDSNGYSSTDQSSYYDTSDDEESETATEGEEEIRARELRKQEVRVEPPVVQTDTGTDTEILSEDSSESLSEVQNSATEISTDSEFAHDDPTPTRELPFIALHDIHVTKTRGSRGNYPKKIQVKSGYLQKPSKDKPSVDLKLERIVAHAPLLKKPAPVLLPRTEGYALNRTQSTGGIAAKVSLELKKKYLLGEVNTGNIQKSGSASTLDTKFKSFQTTISDCQKLLKPAPEISASMQTFCNKLNETKSPVLSPQSSMVFGKGILNTNVKEKENQFPGTIVPDIIENKEIISIVDDQAKENIFENESEGRPRSPAYETSIIVPQINWNKEIEISSDSLATSESDNEQLDKKFENIPRVEIHQPNDEAKDDMALDSLSIIETSVDKICNSEGEILKSITTEKKSLNQPKALPNLENMLPEIHNSLHMKCEGDSISIDNVRHSSGMSTPDSVIEQPTAALTETELSDWARDEAVSEDFEDVYESNLLPNHVSNKKAQVAELKDFDDVHLIEKGHSSDIVENFKDPINLDSIEFMDTGTETSSDDGNIDSQQGYVLLKNDDEFVDDSLNPTINESKNLHLFNRDVKNTGYCYIPSDLKTPVVTLNPTSESIKSNNDHNDEESLQVFETGTTTEENTFSDSTVKNVTEIIPDKQKEVKKDDGVDNNNIKDEMKTNTIDGNVEQTKCTPKEEIIEFDEHCQRLQSKVEFSNARDSIDIRKSRRKSKSELTQKPDLIKEEKIDAGAKEILLNLSPTPHTPDILYNKDVIKKERDVNQKLIQEMVMNKMKAENKSLERKKRNRLSACSVSPNPLSKSATTDIAFKFNFDTPDRKSTYSTSSSTYTTPDVLLTTNNIPIQTSKSILNLESKPTIETTQQLNESLDAETPKAPPRSHRQSDDIHRKLSKLEKSVLSKQGNANKSIKDEPIINVQKRDSWLYSNDSHKKTSSSVRRSTSEESHRQPQKMSLSLNQQEHTAPMRTKSIPDVQTDLLIQEIDCETAKEKMCKSDPNMLESKTSKSKKKSKDRERRKSITKLFTTFFAKKSPTSNGSKGLFSKLSPKSKDISKDFTPEKITRRSSLSELSTNKTPPPIPPLPINYSVKGTDESSEDDHDLKKNGSSCETLNKLGTLELSTSSNTGRRSGRSHKAARQAQLKRHRMAQEIQRKLEETEVKTKELERMGVMVEKALRGEDGGRSSKDESELLQEWFDLMRDRTELRRYEKELLVRAQELELEDRYGRLQHELRERLENNEPKSGKDLKREEDILKEMMDIVSERDSLVKVIEEDRLRYCTEDRDLEEQMLAKGLRLTSIMKSPEK